MPKARNAPRRDPSSKGQSVKHTRSPFGCVRCKHRRQKCDQEKPSCSRCRNAGEQCRYEVSLRWGGRPFRKSCFGECLSTVQKIDDAEDQNSFVYSVPSQASQTFSFALEPAVASPKLSNGTPELSVPLEGSVPVEAVGDAEDVVEELEPTYSGDAEDHVPENALVAMASPAPYDIDPYSFLTPLGRNLLAHYVSDALRITAASSHAASQICQFIIPRAMRVPSLLYATMAFAAVHLKAIGGLVGQPDELIANLQLRSIKHLQTELHELNPESQAVILATTRTLCQTQIFAGERAWRVHLDGARAVMETIKNQIQCRKRNSAININAFLGSWYDNTEALAAITPVGLSKGQFEPKLPVYESIYLDEFGGVCSDIPALFREIGALVVERRRALANDPDPATPILSELDFMAEADALEEAIAYRFERDTPSNLTFSPHMDNVLTPEDRNDYALSNAAFLHTAMLHVRCGVRGLPASALEVQTCVEGIVSCAERMRPLSGFCPRVLLMTPLFAAGSRALGDLQNRIRSQVSDIQGWMRTPHAGQAMELLEEIWAGNEEDIENRVRAVLERKSPNFMPY